MVDWKDWYFERARQRVTPEAKDLFWKQIKPGCSNKVLAQIAKGVLDIEDPHVVDWRFLRPAHVFLRADALDKQTLSGAMNNIKRIVTNGAQRRISSWFMDQLGWRPGVEKQTQISILSEDEFSQIESGAISGLPDDLAMGVKAMMRLMYYAGMSSRQVAIIKSEDITLVDGRMLLYSRGLLYELPDHIRLPLAAWIRMRAEKKQRGRKVKSDGTGKVFRADQARVVSKLPKLPDTFKSIRRLRA